MLVEVLAAAYGFLAVAIIADNHLVTSLETLCVRWNVREDVAGASFMAFGSAAPEIIINAVSTIKTVLAVSDGGAAAVAPEDAGEDTDLGIGAIIGSGMIAFTVIPGVCGLAAKEATSRSSGGRSRATRASTRSRSRCSATRSPTGWSRCTRRR